MPARICWTSQAPEHILLWLHLACCLLHRQHVHSLPHTAALAGHRPLLGCLLTAAFGTLPASQPFQGLMMLKLRCLLPFPVLFPIQLLHGSVQGDRKQHDWNSLSGTSQQPISQSNVGACAAPDAEASPSAGAGNWGKETLRIT